MEFLDLWRRLPCKALFFFLLAAWLALFQFLGNSTMGYARSASLFYWMFRSYNPFPPEPVEGVELHPQVSPDAHGNLVPLVVLGLFWWKRKELLAANIRNWGPGLLLVAGGLAMHLLGYAVQQARISVVGMFTGLYGLMGLVWGPDWLRRSFFPFCLFAFSVPLGSLAEPITFRLRLLVSVLVEAISHFVLQVDVMRDGTKLMDPMGRYEYEVAAACSGIRSLVATVALALVLGVVSFRGWWKRLAMIAAAVPLAVLGNLLRMLVIVIAAEIGGQDSGKKVHDGGIFTLLLYVPAFLGLVLMERYLHRVSPEDTKKPVSGPGPQSDSGAAPVETAEIESK